MIRCKRLIFISQFFHILARYFHEMRGSLNLLTVHSCSQNLPLISCMFQWNFQRRLTLLCLISVSGVKHLPALLAKHIQRRPQFLPADAAKRQTAGIRFTHRPRIRFFAPQGRLVAPIQVKLCKTDWHLGPLGCAKFHINRRRGVGMRPPKYQKFPLFGK